MAPIKFGIVQLPYQLSDVTGPVDILSTSSQAFLQTWQQVDNVPQEIVDKAPDYEFYYIGEKLEEPQTHTGNMKVLPNTTFDTCPKLDYLLVGGPAPDFFMNVPESYAKFLRERVDEVKTVFTTCTGACVVANVGLLDGLKATANHQVIPMMKQVNPKVQWTNEKQWIVDGKFWTAGGAYAGTDMFAHWVTSNYGQEVGEYGWRALDFEPRDVNAKMVPLKHGLRT